MKRPTILTFAVTYLPGYKAGGPIRSLSAMFSQLGDEFDFRLRTRDRDFQDTAAYPGCVPGVWQRVGKAHVMYLAAASQHLRNAANSQSY